jgi:hypothetical protein
MGHCQSKGAFSSDREGIENAKFVDDGFDFLRLCCFSAYQINGAAECCRSIKSTRAVYSLAGPTVRHRGVLCGHVGL